MPRNAIATGHESTHPKSVLAAIFRGSAISSLRYTPTKGATINQAIANGAAVNITCGIAASPVASPWLPRPIAAKARKASMSPNGGKFGAHTAYAQHHYPQVG